eukprot:TRINITY_DN16497_c0_g1_i1.p1 TRINITY_DN16497_c0_g1~~TRINITY_DN16497_c0_g1_i1.p1  ORF type:complete len:592 (+),score=122.46 TRINITY_DN16497_c0_g1_i1:282-2057(+)
MARGNGNRSKEYKDNNTPLKLNGNYITGEEWIDLLRLQSQEWEEKPLVVLSLFDGIGAIWEALTILGIPFVGYSSEIDPCAIQVVKERYPKVKHVGDVKNLKTEDIKEKVDLLVGGFPCQDLSSMGRKVGLHGERSKLFFDLLQAMQMFEPYWFLVENVASMSWVDRDEICKYIACLPIELDSQDLTPGKRRRLYWTNIPFPETLPNVRDNSSTSLQSVLENATALQTKTKCIMSSSSKIGKMGSFQQVLNNNDGTLRDVSVTELEKIMGFPTGHTKFDLQAVQSSRSPKSSNLRGPNSNGKAILQSTEIDNIRWRMLGNSFSVKTVAYLLSSLINKSVRDNKVEHKLPYRNIQAEECSVMDPGELWVLYNGRGLPNWYGIIVNRSGGRFTMKSHKNGNTHVQVEVRFLELSYEYGGKDEDEQCPERGTGRYKICRDTEHQNSWFAFSHRMKSYWKNKHAYFIYPGKGEVWAINHRWRAKTCPFFVYVADSEFSIPQNKLGSTKPGKEKFKAKCYALQQTLDAEVYKITDKLLAYEDLSVFIYSVPYYYKDAKGLLKIEYTNQKEIEHAGALERTSKRRRQDYDSSDDEED